MRIFYVIGLILFVALFAKAERLNICQACFYKTIKSALDASGDGDTLVLKKGVYKEFGLVISSSIYFIGEDGAVVDGENKGEVITIVADNVTLQNLTIQNVGTSYIEDRAGIRVKKSKDFTLLNNRLYNTFFGIYLEHAKNGIIEGNIVKGDAQDEMSSGNAIHLWYSKNVIIKNNVTHFHRDGIYLEFVDSSRIINNLSEDNLRYGLHFMFSNNDDYENNTFRRNGAGVAVMFSKKINMINNIFENNWGRSAYGLLLKEIYDAEILQNVFEENTIGIFVEGSTRINYAYNQFKRNGWAIKISGGCLDNKISKNNFISNTFDLSLGSTMKHNSFDGNYWTEYNGYDLDYDGIGDIPHRPVKMFNFVINQTPEAIILLRSLFVDLLNFAEKVSPVFSSGKVEDSAPLMKMIAGINSKSQ